MTCLKQDVSCPFKQAKDFNETSQAREEDGVKISLCDRNPPLEAFVCPGGISTASFPSSSTKVSLSQQCSKGMGISTGW